MPTVERKRIRLNRSVYSQAGHTFSVTLGTSPRLPVFSDVRFGLSCIAELRSLAAATSTGVWAYCLMPDHVHLLLEIGAAPLPTFLQAWKSRCYHVRRAQGHAGRFWQRSFFDHALRSAEDLQRAVDYILANPVRKGLVAEAGSYPLAGSFAFDPWVNRS